MKDERKPQPAAIDYTNYKGERAWRRVMPIKFYYGVNDWHEGEQWFMEGMDLERNVRRVFAMNKIHYWKTE